MRSFEVIFYRHYDRVYGLLFRLLGDRAEAEDVLQELFLKLYRRPLTGAREHNVGAWLYRAATNMAYNAIRDRGRRRRRIEWAARQESEAVPDPAEAAAARDTQAAVRAALARLPERQTQMLLLRQMGLSYAELAEACEVAPGSVGTMLARAARAFRRAYEEAKK
jgi:RNA polymerase sigma-70 factor (ECF subfamily)